MKLGLVIFLSISVLGSAPGQPDSLFSKANSHYREGQFNDAVEDLNAILDSGYHSPDLFYNLGNAYYRTGQLGFAILNYERALKMDPGMEDARTNLTLLESGRVDKFETVPQPLIQRIREWIFIHIPSYVWMVMGISTVLLAVIFLVLFYRSRRTRGGFLILSIILIVVSGLTFLINEWNRGYGSARRFGVVVSGNTYVKSEPGEKRTDLFILHEGTKARVLEDSNDWYEIRLPDGKQGWVRKGDFLEI